VAQINDELVYVSSTDDNNLNLAPFGRGYFGSTTTSHNTNSVVVANPMFPNVAIRNAINECVEGVYPTIYQVQDTTFVYNTGQVVYSLPAEAEQVLTVEWQRSDASAFWEPMLEWDLIENSQEATGKAIALLESPFQGATVQVTYSRKHAGFPSDGTTLAAAGFNESCVDIFVFGAMARLVRAVDVARLQVRNAENYARAGFVASGDANRVANQYYAYYQQRLDEERKRLLNTYPPRPHFER
jgi:hypothetical protein